MRKNTAGAAEAREYHSITKFLADDSGQGLIEYAIILSVGLIVGMGAMTLFGGSASATITTAGKDFSDAFEFQAHN